MNEEIFEQLEDMGAEIDDTLDRLAGDKELYMQYLIKFPQNENFPALKQAVNDADKEKAMKEVHTLKGVALNLGLLPLVDVCMDMLMDFRAGETESAYGRMDSVKNVFQEIVNIIEQKN